MRTGKMIVLGALLLGLLAGCEWPDQSSGNGAGSDVPMSQASVPADANQVQDQDQTQNRGG